MSIEFSEEKRFIAFWFVYPGPPTLRDGRRHDWFCGSWLNPDGTLEFHYRFHYYDEPDDPSDGERSWQGMKSREPVDAAAVINHVEVTNQMAMLNVIRNGGSKMDIVQCELCTGPEAVEKLKQYPWFHEASGRMYQEA